MIILLGWNRQLGNTFWDNVDRIPRNIDLSTYPTLVFYLTDTTTEEFPDSTDSITQFFEQQRPKEAISEVEAKLWFMRPHESTMIGTSRMYLERHSTLLEFKRMISHTHLQTIAMTLERIYDSAE
jgi:hypothetical protein